MTVEYFVVLNKQVNPLNIILRCTSSSKIQDGHHTACDVIYANDTHVFVEFSFHIFNIVMLILYALFFIKLSKTIQHLFNTSKIFENNYKMIRWSAP